MEIYSKKLDAILQFKAPGKEYVFLNIADKKTGESIQQYRHAQIGEKPGSFMGWMSTWGALSEIEFEKKCKRWAKKFITQHQRNGDAIETALDVAYRKAYEVIGGEAKW